MGTTGYSIGPEPDDQIRPFYATGELRNYTAFSVPGVDALIEQQLGEIDANARVEIVHNLQRLILDSDPGLIWLHDGGWVAVLRPYVNGWRATTDSPHNYRYDPVWLAEHA